MKTLQLICLITGLFIFLQTNSQNPVTYPKTSDDPVNRTETDTNFMPDSSIVVVNLEMTRRFREYKPDQELVNFSDILTNHNFNSIKEVYVV